MSIQEWAGFILTLLSIIAALGFGVRWVIRHYLKDILHEVKPNGGSSIKDQVNRMESDIKALQKQNADGEEFHKRMDAKLDHLTDVFIDYISKK